MDHASVSKKEVRTKHNQDYFQSREQSSMCSWKALYVGSLLTIRNYYLLGPNPSNKINLLGNVTCDGINTRTITFLQENGVTHFQRANHNFGISTKLGQA